MEQIDRKDYPELNLILWDMHDQFIEPSVAFELYERRWGHVAENQLCQEEIALIKELISEFGNGVFMPAGYTSLKW